MKRVVLFAVLFMAVISTLVVSPWSDNEHRLFKRCFGVSLSDTAEIVKLDHRPGREWRVFFHLKTSPSEFDGLRMTKPYRKLEQDSSDFKTFKTSTYQFFAELLPSSDLLPHYEIYEYFDDGVGTASYLISNSEQTDIFAFCVRF